MNKLKLILMKRNFCTNQSGFSGRFSTGTCLVHLTDYIKFQMDKSHLVGMVLLELQKAFDIVGHGLFIDENGSTWFLS